MSKPLTPKQARFVQEYLIDLNASAAYRRAGYKSGNADVCGPRLLGNAGIKEAIRIAIAERSKRTEVTQDRVIKELARIAFVDTSRFVQFVDGRMVITETADLTEDERRALSELSESVTEGGRTRKLKVHDKLKALELLGKHLGIFVEKIDAKVSTDKPIVVKVVRKTEPK